MPILKFYSIEFLSKDGYKSNCIMPANDEKMAENKFVKLMDLRGDKRPKINRIEDLGLSDGELNKFCEESSNFSERVNKLL